ncbi:hypothetical protein CBS147333_1716 [Penicillium roqueforti]|nr:hypothetical protein CBS147372_960 [Penicillium roqueforti]KAI3115319.1 hypothetical protein CBS147333_1716 [Penicillium roqueforti]KAI3241456.1 hypothetical protein CBS147310_803 [Penicillium roqueforti]KAI3261458.1 hypothetical protein DTO012A9_2410 [Penicillium roqueforti]KAI3279278.1 hypothetical protein CBS147308_619 [Penicillium roqueforti]
MTSREETVLAPTNPSVTDENDWWEFSLTDVKVLKPGKMLYANLLDATEQNPVQVIGCLEPLHEDQEHLVLNPDNPPKRIIIDEVTHYAYGQTEDKSIELWVAGKAGWYDIISPAKGFTPTYNRMVQAIDLLYFLVDKHQQGKRQINPSFRSLCEQYTYHTYGSCETREQSAEVFGTHASFLLRCMIQGDSDVEWKKTSVFVHLRRRFNDEYNRLLEELEPSEESETEPADEPEVTTPRHQPAAISKSQADAIYQLLKDLREEGHLAKRRLHIDLLGERFAERFSLSNEDAQKIIAFRASAVLEMMDEEDFRWSRYVIHRELTHASTTSAPLPTALLTPLDSQEESSDDEQGGRTQKSVLRPRVHTVSNKATGKRNRNAPANQQTVESNEEDEEDTDEIDIDEIETPSKTRGYELIRDPFSATKPRTRSFFAASSTGAGSSLMESLFKDNIKKDKLQTPPVSSSPSRQTLTPERNPTPDTPHEIEEFIDEISDTWTCRMPGCEKVVSTTDKNERKKIIGDHAGEHEWEMQMKVELMESEKRMHTSFPVNNLMQYVVDAHVLQMRTAFPEFYSINKENGTTENGQHPLDEETSIPETEGLEEQNDEDEEDDEDQELEDLANGTVDEKNTAPQLYTLLSNIPWLYS